MKKLQWIAKIKTSLFISFFSIWFECVSRSWFVIFLRAFLFQQGKLLRFLIQNLGYTLWYFKGIFLFHIAQPAEVRSYFNKIVSVSVRQPLIFFRCLNWERFFNPNKDDNIGSFDFTKKEFNLLSNLIETKAPWCLS